MSGSWSDELALFMAHSGAVVVVLVLIAVSIGVTLLLSTRTSAPDTD